MTFFESLLVLLLAAVVLLQLSRRMQLPYPAMLALAGVAVAFIPGAPNLKIDPETTLALFIAPVLLDAAFDFPISDARRLWRPLLVMAAGAVLATAAVVAFIGWRVMGLPIAAACVLGAIVAPPDAAAAVAVLGSVSLPRRTEAILKGESLFNDAVALLIFTAALTVQAQGEVSGATALNLSLAVPGGIALGVACGFVMRWMTRWVGASLGGNLLQFLNTFAVWIIAERLHLSAVLAVCACAMTVARSAAVTGAPRMRVHSFAVWAAVVFVLNVLAFLMMGMQARTILERLPSNRLWDAARMAGLVILALVITRFVVVMIWNTLARRFPAVRGGLPAPTIGQGLVISWSGMRGLVTLATAFALPAGFPQRDVVVLVAFAVVLATLVAQGLTLAPLIRLLKVDRMEDPDRDLFEARQALSQAGVQALKAGPAAGDLRISELYALKTGAEQPEAVEARLKDYRALGLAVVHAQRDALAALRDSDRLSTEAFYQLQEEIDWRELTLLPDQERRIDES